MKVNKLFECSFCGNEWSLDEGFVLKTMQCKGYDDAQPQRDKEKKERMKSEEEFKSINFPYVAGDPYW